MRNFTFDQEMLAKNYWQNIEETHNIGKSREHRNVMYRHAFSVACRATTSLSLKAIGKILNKDHATVLHAIKYHESNYRFDSQYHEIYTEIHTCLSEIIEENTDKVYNVVKEKALQFDPEVFNDHVIVMYKRKLEKQEQQHKKRANELEKTVEALKKHNKYLQTRVDALNKEGLRLKNLL